MSEDNRQLPDYDEWAKALGHMSMTMQYLESRLTTVLGTLLEKEDLTIGNIIASKISFRNLCETVKALVIYKFKDGRVAGWITALTDKSKALDEKRNTFIHSNYLTGLTSTGPVLFARLKHKIGKKGYLCDFENHDQSDTEQLNNDIKELAYDFDDFIMALEAHSHGNPLGPTKKYS